MSFQYGASDWRGQDPETFQLYQKTVTGYTTTPDATLISVEEVLWEWASAPADSATGHLYDDGKYYRDLVQIFQPTKKTVTSYAAAGANSYIVSVTVVDLLTGASATLPTTVVDGSVPKAPRKNSAYSRVYQQPIIKQVADTCIGDHFSDNHESVDLSGAESDDQAQRMLDWETFLQTAIHRSVDARMIPLEVLAEGATVRFDIPSHGIDKLGLLWTITGTGDESKGALGATYEALFPTR